MEKLTFAPRAKNYYFCNQTKEKMTRDQIEGYKVAYDSGGIESAKAYLENRRIHGKDKSKKAKHSSKYRSRHR